MGILHETGRLNVVFKRGGHWFQQWITEIKGTTLHHILKIPFNIVVSDTSHIPMYVG
jgi:hypothetical protein